MSSGFIAFHYPRPDQFADFIDRTRLARETLLSQPGCRSAEIWATPDHAVVTTGTFDSERADQQAFGIAGALGDAVVFDDRERKTREVTTMDSQ